MSTNIDLPLKLEGIPTDEQWDRLFDKVAEAVKNNPEHPLLVGRLDGNPVQTRAPWDPDAERWIQGVQATGASRWEAGIQRPRADFKTAALANNDGWKAGVTKAVTENRFAKGMETVNTEEAIATALAVGGAGYAAGAAARRSKFERNTNAIKARMAAAVQTVRNMPAKTDADREARAIAMIKGARAAARGT